MTIEQEPFRLSKDESTIAAEKAQSLILNVRLNAAEQARLVEAKKMLNIHMDSTAFKVLAWAGFNVLHSTLGPELLSYITSETRRREVIDKVIGKPAGVNL